jgi:histone deacetylase 8
LKLSLNFSDTAPGFSYVNDAVLAILELRKLFQRVLYIDVDLHHGDGVEDAFLYSSNVFVFSLHRFDRGFYPGSGDVTQIGRGRGKGATRNIPLKGGLSDEVFASILDLNLPQIYQSFKPDAIVVLCGTDGLAGDPLNEWNLTTKSFEHVYKIVKSFDKPTLWLGGGGYNSANTARCQVALTAAIIGVVLPEDIPECDNFEIFAPTFTRLIERGYLKDENGSESVSNLYKTAIDLFNVQQDC